MTFCLCESYFLRHKLPLVHHTITFSDSIHDKFEDKTSQNLLSYQLLQLEGMLAVPFPSHLLYSVRIT